MIHVDRLSKTFYVHKKAPGLRASLKALVKRNRVEKKAVIFVTHDVEEAVFLADRIFMFSARPATIIEVIEVARHITGKRTITTKETEAFFHLRNHVRDLMRSQAKDLEDAAKSREIEE